MSARSGLSAVAALVMTVSGVFKRMGEVAGVAARLLGLLLAVREQLVDLVDQRADLQREILGDAGLRARADRDHFAPDPAQRPQAVERLQRGEHQKPGAERGEAGDQRRAQVPDLAVDHVARLGDLEPPADIAAGQDDIALDDAQRLAGEFAAVVGVQRDVVVIARRAGGGPTRERDGKVSAPVPLTWK